MKYVKYGHGKWHRSVFISVVKAAEALSEYAKEVYENPEMLKQFERSHNELTECGIGSYKQFNR